MQNWWEAAPLAPAQPQGGNWWEAAPLAEPDAPDVPEWQRYGAMEAGTATASTDPMRARERRLVRPMARPIEGFGDVPNPTEGYNTNPAPAVVANMRFARDPNSDEALTRATRRAFGQDVPVGRSAPEDEVGYEQGRRFYVDPRTGERVMVDAPGLSPGEFAGRALASLPEAAGVGVEVAGLIAAPPSGLARVAAGGVAGGAGAAVAQGINNVVGRQLGMIAPNEEGGSLTGAATTGAMFGAGGVLVGNTLRRFFDGAQPPAFLGEVNPQVLEDGLRLTNQRILTDAPQTIMDVASAAANDYRRQIAAGAPNREELLALEQDALRLAGRARTAEEALSRQGSEEVQRTAAQRAQAQQQGTRMVGPDQPVDREAAGGTARNAVQAERDTRLGAFGQVYDMLEQSVGGVNVPLQYTRQLVTQLRSELDASLLERPGNRAVIDSILAKLNSGQPFTLADIRNTATVLKERSRSIDPERAVDSATVGRLIDALERDRDAALNAAGRGNVAQAYRTLDAQYANTRRQYREGVVGDVLDQREPGVFSMARGDVVDAIAKASPSEIRTIRNAMQGSPQSLAQFEDAVRQRLAASVIREGGIANGDRLTRALAVGTREGDAIRAALPPDQIKNLERIANELSLAQRQPARLGGAEDDKTTILRRVARAYVGVFTASGRALTAAQAAVGIQAKNSLERAITDPAYLSDLARLSRMSPSSRAAQDLAASLGIEALVNAGTTP